MYIASDYVLQKVIIGLKYCVQEPNLKSGLLKGWKNNRTLTVLHFLEVASNASGKENSKTHFSK